MSLISNLRLLIKDTIFYGVAGFFSKSATLLTLPILSRHFSVEEYGIINSLNLLAYLIATFLLMGQESAIVRFFYDEKNYYSRCQLITKSLILQITTTCALLPVIWWAKNLLIDHLAYGSNHNINQLTDLIVGTAPFILIQANAQAILRITFARKEFLILSLGMASAIMAAAFTVVLFFGDDLLVLFKAYLATNVVFALLGILFIRKWLKWPASITIDTRTIHYALPIGLIVLIGTAQPFLERLLVNLVGTPKDLGLYAVGATIATIITLPINAFQTAFTPLLMSKYKDASFCSYLNFFLKLYVLLLCASVVIVAGFGELLVRLMAGEEYIHGANVITPLLLGLSIQAIGLFLGVGTILARKTYLRLISYSSSLIVGSVCMFTFGAKFGIVGVAIGAAVGKIVMLIMESIIGQYYFYVRWSYSSVLIMLAISTLLATVLSTIGSNVFIMTIVLTLSLGLMVFILWCLLDSREKSHCITSIKCLLNRH